MKRILAIDYGDVRVGLAVSDVLHLTAQGIDNLVINNSDKKFINGIKKIVEEYDVDTIVIGYPKNMDGTLSDKAKKIDGLVPKLEELVGLVEKWDERLTTVSAYKLMRQLNISQKNKNIYADKMAATYILEGYLEKIAKK